MQQERSRDYYFDNVKCLLIALVVFGHVIEVLQGTALLFVYQFIYLFHMPAFIMITGYFSKKTPKVETLILQYLIFQTLYLAFDKLVYSPEKASEGFALQYTQPYWIMWYLFAIIIWKLLVPYLSKYKTGIVLPVLILIAVLVGYDDSLGLVLSASRILVFFPFFYFGYAAKEKQVDWIKKIPAWVGILFLVLSVLLLKLYLDYNPQFDYRFLYGSASYQKRGFEEAYAGIYRLILILWGGLLSLAVFSVVPKRRIPVLSAMGTRTNQLYLLHGFLIRAWPLFVDATNWTLQDKLWYGGIIAISSVVLLTKPVGWLLKPLFEPISTYRLLKNKIQQKFSKKVEL